MPAGSRLILTANVLGRDLIAIGYKYNRKKKVLFFVRTPGAGSVDENGERYVQRWADDHGNIITRDIPRLAVLSKYFEVSPRVVR